MSELRGPPRPSHQNCHLWAEGRGWRSGSVPLAQPAEPPARGVHMFQKLLHGALRFPALGTGGGRIHFSIQESCHSFSCLQNVAPCRNVPQRRAESPGTPGVLCVWSGPSRCETTPCTPQWCRNHRPQLHAVTAV